MSHPTSRVICKDCGTQFEKRTSQLASWAGQCKSCYNKSHTVPITADTNGTLGKRCTKCGEWRPLDRFCWRADKHRKRSHHESQCQFCKGQHTAAYRAAHPDQIRVWRTTHTTEIQAYWKIYHQQHRDHLLQRFRVYGPAYYARNVDRWAAWSRAWRAQHPDAVRAIRHRRRAREHNAPGSFTAAEWAALKARYNYRCLLCGRQEPEIKLSVDHIRPLSLGGSNDIGNIQPLCCSCNSRKNAKAIDFRGAPDEVRAD